VAGMRMQRGKIYSQQLKFSKFRHKRCHATPARKLLHLEPSGEIKHHRIVVVRHGEVEVRESTTHLEAMAEPQPKVLNFASSILPSAPTLICRAHQGRHGSAGLSKHRQLHALTMGCSSERDAPAASSHRRMPALRQCLCRHPWRSCRGCLQSVDPARECADDATTFRRPRNCLGAIFPRRSSR